MLARASTLPILTKLLGSINTCHSTVYPYIQNLREKNTLCSNYSLKVRVDKKNHLILSNSLLLIWGTQATRSSRLLWLCNHTQANLPSHFIYASTIDCWKCCLRTLGRGRNLRKHCFPSQIGNTGFLRARCAELRRQKQTWSHRQAYGVAYSEQVARHSKAYKAREAVYNYRNDKWGH